MTTSEPELRVPLRVIITLTKSVWIGCQTQTAAMQVILKDLAVAVMHQSCHYLVLIAFEPSVPDSEASSESSTNWQYSSDDDSERLTDLS